MTAFSQAEKSVVESILNQGFKQVTQTFSEISQRQISLRSQNIELLEGDNQGHLLEGLESPVHFLTTEIIGDLRGKSFLIFQPHEVDQLIQLCLPSLVNEENKAELGTAMLLELDNMLSANVVTHISNFLKVKIYGDVPKLQVLSVADAEQEIAKTFQGALQDADDNWFLMANVSFLMDGGEPFHPTFVWKFTNQFIEAVKNYMQGATY